MASRFRSAYFLRLAPALALALALVAPLAPLVAGCASPREPSSVRGHVCPEPAQAALPSATSSVANVQAPPAPEAADPDQKLADLGACELESGQRVEGCQVGYRTFGTLDEAKSNVVLFPTWFTGTTKQLVDVVPDKLVDTKRFYLILVDALGDGVSTSPSTSRAQARLAFPRFTVKDMVESQRRMLTEVFGITHLRAVMGISMGGMQAIEWGVSHPELVERIAVIVGSPQLTSNDLLLWSAELHALQDDAAYAKGNYAGRPQLRAVLDLHNLALTTPAYRVAQTSRSAFPEWVAAREAETSFDWNDWHRQLEAMMAHDVTKPYGGSMDAAAKRVKGEALFVVAEHDHMVSPIPARAFAKAMGAKAEVVVLDGPCGHIAPTCEATKLAHAVAPFLAK